MNNKLLGRLGCALLVGACFVSQAIAQSGGSDSNLNSLLGPAPTASANATPTAQGQTAAPATGAASASPSDSSKAAAAAKGDVAANTNKKAVAVTDGGAPGAGGTASETAAANQGAPVTDKPVAATPARRKVKSRITEEIVVTAERRKQNLQDVPASVAAFTGPALDAKGLTDTKDLQNITPGLTYGTMATYAIIFIRGVGSDAYAVNANSAVAQYLDGLYLPFTFSAATALGQVERIEVLKGPQGALYGRNAVGGAIAVTLKPPTKTYTGNVMVQYGNYSDYKAKVGFSGPVPYTDDRLLFDISGIYEDHKSYTINGLGAQNTHPYHHFRNRDLRGVLQYEPIDGVTLTGAAYYIETQDVDDVATNIYAADPTLAALGVVTADQRPHVSGNADSIGENGTVKIYQFIAKDETQVPWFTTKLVLGHIDAGSQILFDYDAAPQPILDISALPNTERSDSAEILFTSKPEGTPDVLEWLVGASYANETRTGRYPVTVDPTAIAIGLPGSGFFGGISPLCTIYQNQFGGDCTFNTQNNQNPLIQAPLRAGFRNKSLSVYTQTTFHVTDKLDTVFGFRATHESEALLYSNVQARLIFPGITGVSQTITTPTLTAINFTPQVQYDNAFTPTAGLNYHVTPDIMVYYKYSEGFLSANYNGLNVIEPPVAVKPEDASANEIGFKTTLLPDRSLKFNGSIFDNKLTNNQVQTVALTGGGVTTLQNAGSSDIYGADFDINYFPIDGLVLNFSGTYLHGRYGKFIGREFDQTTGVNLADNFKDFSGNKTVRTPSYSATIGVDYTFPFFFGLTAEVGGSGYYNSGYLFDPNGGEGQPSYYDFGARGSLYDPRTHIRVSGYADNINNAVFFTNGFVNDFGNAVIYGKPRTFGIQVSWDYGES